MEIEYLKLLNKILAEGTYKPSARENMPGTYSLFGYQMRHNLQEGFPLLTTKKMFWKGVVAELLWFLRGDTNIKYLIDNCVNIWNEDAYNYYLKLCKQQNVPNPFQFGSFIEAIKANDLVKYPVVPKNYILGDCGFQYGKLWRDWTGDQGFNHGNRKIDQIADLIKGLKESPMGRRHIITAWNPATLDKMALNACHALVQFNCKPLSNLERVAYSKGNLDVDSTQDKFDNSAAPKYYLDCQMYQRSADVFLGVPFNIASYALLTHILAKICNMVPGDFVHTFGDVHLYENHVEAAKEQLSRQPKELPQLKIKPCPIDGFHLDNLNIGNFEIENYDPHPAIKAELSTGLKK